MATSEMSQQEMQSMMREMMENLFANMTPDDKKEIMMGMMDKMKEGIDMHEMMPKVMIGLMSAEEGAGGMSEMMAKMMQGGQEQESMMPEMMLKGMMPHCIKMMMPAIAQDRRADLVLGMVSNLVDQGSSGMSEREKAGLVAKIVEKIQSIG